MTNRPSGDSCGSGGRGSPAVAISDIGRRSCARTTSVPRVTSSAPAAAAAIIVPIQATERRLLICGRLRILLVFARRLLPGVGAVGRVLLEPLDLGVHLEQVVAQLGP